jgi:hypothetical protein
MATKARRATAIAGSKGVRFGRRRACGLEESVAAVVLEMSYEDGPGGGFLALGVGLAENVRLDTRSLQLL